MKGHKMLCRVWPVRQCEGLSETVEATVQVIRTKHKIKAFQIAAKASAGCMATLSLALSNNTLEVCAQAHVP